MRFTLWLHVWVSVGVQVCALSKFTLYWYCVDSLHHCKETCYAVTHQIYGCISGYFVSSPAFAASQTLHLLTEVIQLLRHWTAVSCSQWDVEGRQQMKHCCFAPESHLNRLSCAAGTGLLSSGLWLLVDWWCGRLRGPQGQQSMTHDLQLFL